MGTPRHSIGERLAEFYHRLGGLPLPATPDEALSQICETIDAVEDDLSGLPKNDPPPRPGIHDGRMYPPIDDMIVRHATGAMTALTRRHTIDIGADASIVIRVSETGEIQFSKSGAK